MVAEENLSPEEKLLKAVEQGSPPKVETAASNPRPGAGEEKRGQTPFDFPSLLNGAVQALKSMGAALEMKLHELKGKGVLPAFVKFPSLSEWRPDLPTINNVFTAVVGLLFLVLVGDIIFYRPKALLDTAVSGPPALPEFFSQKEGPAKELAHYTELADSRNLFQPHVPRPVAPPPPAAGEVAALQAAGPTNLKLVAVAEIEGGFEAIVEDPDKTESHFLRKGDQFGDYKVQSIDWDRVVFVRGQDRWEVK